MNAQIKIEKNRSAKMFTQKLFALGSLIILVIVFSILSQYFLTFENILTILISTCVTGILAIGTTFVIITGAFDLSLGTVMTLSTVMMGTAVIKWGWPIWLGLIVLVATGALFGFINGILVAKAKVPPFVVTMGTMMIAKGLSLIITGAVPIYFNTAPVIPQIATSSIVGQIIPGLNIPNAVFIFLIMAFIGHIVLNKTILGRYTLAIGSNEEAVRLSGIKTDKIRIGVFTLCSAICALAGIIMVGRLNSVQPALGQGYELNAIAAVVIGGTSLNGGSGTMSGTVIGAFVLQVLLNGLRILGIANEWQTVATGIIIIFAVYLDQISRRGLEKAA